MDWTYVRVISWHIPRPKDHSETAYCGQNLVGRTEFSDVLPGKGKRCDTCLYITRRIEEHANDPAMAGTEEAVD